LENSHKRFSDLPLNTDKLSDTWYSSVYCGLNGNRTLASEMFSNTKVWEQTKNVFCASYNLKRRQLLSEFSAEYDVTPCTPVEVQ
jgi:hypothetical protein